MATDLTADCLTFRHPGSRYAHMRSPNEAARSIPCTLRSRVVHAPGAKQRRPRCGRPATVEPVPRMQHAHREPRTGGPRAAFITSAHLPCVRSPDGRRAWPDLSACGTDIARECMPVAGCIDGKCSANRLRVVDLEVRGSDQRRARRRAWTADAND